jgi:cytoskeleton protein RodZ
MTVGPSLETDEPQTVESVESPADLTAGQMIRQAREAIGMHIAILALTLKLPVKRLEALEADQWDRLPDPVFVRATASSVCRALKIDPAPVLAKLPKGRKEIFKQSEELGLNQPYKSSEASGSASSKDQWTTPMARITGLILLVAALVFFMPDINVQDLFSAAPDPYEPTSALQSNQVVLPSSDATATASAAAETSKPVAVNVPVPDIVSVGDQLTFKVNETSWVEVTDLKGKVVLRRNLDKNETVSLDLPTATAATLPWAVVVGRVDATEVMVRGKRLAIDVYTRENVARFEVK